MRTGCQLKGVEPKKKFWINHKDKETTIMSFAMTKAQSDFLDTFEGYDDPLTAAQVQFLKSLNGTPVEEITRGLRLGFKKQESARGRQLDSSVEYFEKSHGYPVGSLTLDQVEQASYFHRDRGDYDSTVRDDVSRFGPVERSGMKEEDLEWTRELAREFLWEEQTSITEEEEEEKDRQAAENMWHLKHHSDEDYALE
jgi:hypothetical protein